MGTATPRSSLTFFFSSRRRHTRFDCDWSSDVCSSDLEGLDGYTIGDGRAALRVEWNARTMPYLWVWQEHGGTRTYPWWGRLRTVGLERSEERRVGKSVDLGGRRIIKKKKK